MADQTDDVLLNGERVAAVAEAARQTLGCRAVVVIAIGERNARTAVAHPSMSTEDALACAAGSIHLARGLPGQDAEAGPHDA